VRYRKGPNFADEGNFSTAGAAEIIYLRTVAAPQASLTVGENACYRAGLDSSQADDPCDVPQDFRKLNGLANAGLVRDRQCRGVLVHRPRPGHPVLSLV
jgi:hypothetical protein